MKSRLIAGIALGLLAIAVPAASADCPLDHYFFFQNDGTLQTDNSRIYRHGDPVEGYYPLTWSSIYQRWSTGEPGFSDTTAPAYGFPPEIQLVGTPNVDYQVWFEVVDLSADFSLQVNDGTWLDEIGERYNLSNWPDHHVHMKYCAYVPADPPPDYPFYVTYRLVDDFGAYAPTPPFSLVFNVPAPTVETTTPAYRDILPSLTSAEISFTFHRPIVVSAGPPVTITDEATQTADYYTGCFDYAVAPDGLTLTLSQYGGALPNETWLEISLTDHVCDADNDQPAIPFTHYTYTWYLPGNCDNDTDVDLADFDLFAGCLSAPDVAVSSACACDDLDGDEDVDLADFLTIQTAFTGPAE